MRCGPLLAFHRPLAPHLSTAAGHVLEEALDIRRAPDEHESEDESKKLPTTNCQLPTVTSRSSTASAESLPSLCEIVAPEVEPGVLDELDERDQETLEMWNNQA